ncbi:MAG: NAD(+) synthase [Bacillota bacterium]
MNDMKKELENIVSWLQEKVEAANAKGIVLGLSGGVDSAVVAGLAKKAFPNDAMGVIMPINSNSRDEADALIVARSLDIDVTSIDLSPVYDSFLKALPFEGENPLAKANLKPRLRMMTLYYFAQEMGYLVCGTSNKSELHVGYFTKHGDSGVDLLPIADFVKEEVYELARLLDVPVEIIEKPPSAGLWENQTDEKEMGFTYQVLDKYIRTGEGPEESVNKIKHMNKISEHKRNYPPTYKKS